MKNNDLHNLIINKLGELDKKIDSVRTTDIPELKTAVSGFRTEIDSLKTSQTWSTRLYTLAGGAIAVFVSTFTGRHH